MKDSKIIIFLYTTMVGRAILRILVNPGLSKFMASVMSSSFSGRFVSGFIKKNGIDMSDYYIPDGGYKSFNDFFTRKKKTTANTQGGFLQSPCDALLTVSHISEESIFNIKRTEYSVASLLGDESLAEQFMGGTAYIFRLTPAHYHRYNFCAEGRLIEKKTIAGVLHSVQPICHEKTDVFVQNSREYVVIDSDKLGRIVQMEIGALLVGKISNHPVNTDSIVSIGSEKGYFEYGGSSIVVLTQTQNELPDDVRNRERVADEIPVKISEKLI